MSSIKRDVKKKLLPRPDGEGLVSRSSPLTFGFVGEAWFVVHAHKIPQRMVAMPSSSKERQAGLVLKGNHSSIRGSWPMAISGYPRGHSVKCVTRCRSTRGPISLTDTPLEPSSPETRATTT